MSVGAEGVRRGERRVYDIPPKRLIVTAVVAALVADDTEQLVPLPGQDPTQGQAFRERHLSRIFGGTAPVEDRPG